MNTGHIKCELHFLIVFCNVITGSRAFVHVGDLALLLLEKGIEGDGHAEDFEHVIESAFMTARDYFPVFASTFS